MSRWNTSVSVCAAASIAGLMALTGRTTAGQAPTTRPMTFDDLIAMRRVSEPRLSPDAARVAYRVSTPDKATNRSVSDIWIAPARGGTSRQLTRSGRDSSPRWSRDGTRIAFLSSRDGAPQVYVARADGGDEVQVTRLSGGADNLQWSPDGRLLAFTSEVYPDCQDDRCNARRDADLAGNPVTARIYDRLLYRHWTAWSSGKRSHVFVVSSAGGAPRDLTPGAGYDVPPVQRGDSSDIAFSADGTELCFAAVTDPVEATSTNGDLFVVAVSGLAPPRRITTNPGFDGHPAYSPDGRFIAYHAQLTPGYESDRWRLMRYERQSGRHVNLTEGFDRSVNAVVWSADSRSIYFDAESAGYAPLFAISADGSLAPREIVGGTSNGEPTISADGARLAFTRSSLTMPAEVFTAGANGGDVQQATHHNTPQLANLDLKPAETFTFRSVDGVQVHGLIVRPPGFDPARRYPLLLLCHGGPQTMWGDNWGYRWNPQLFASPGYVVALINRRGSTGFGQSFADAIQDDYGGKAYEDLLAGADYLLATYPFIDAARQGAAGASYGGFMVNWIATHAKGRFKVLVSHAGVYDQQSFYGATEELWFPERDLKGTPWTNAGSYRKWSPATYAADLGTFKTPTLVIHGEQDYRVPYDQGLAFFTALQRQGVPSRLLVFPDEGHWILKPLNSELWYRTVLDWIGKYLK